MLHDPSFPANPFPAPVPFVVPLPLATPAPAAPNRSRVAALYRVGYRLDPDARDPELEEAAEDARCNCCGRATLSVQFFAAPDGERAALLVCLHPHCRNQEEV